MQTTHDTVSATCGNGDGTTFCGTDGSDAKVIFLDAEGNTIQMPSNFFSWDGNVLTFKADDDSAIGDHQFTM